MNDRGIEGGGGAAQLSDAEIFKKVEAAIALAGPNEDLDSSELAARQARDRVASVYRLGGGRIRQPE